MTTPVVESAVTKPFASATTSHLMDYPATVNVGELLLIIFVRDDNGTITTPDGYTLLDQEAIAAAGEIAIFVKDADGDEDGGTEDVVTGAAVTAAGQIFRISNWGGNIATDIDIALPVTETTTTPNPPAVTAGWGAATNLFIAIVGAANDNETASSGPAGWADLLTIAAGGGANAGPSAHTARLASGNATENPGTFTLSGSETCESFTLVIKPSSSSVVITDVDTDEAWNDGDTGLVITGTGFL